MTYLGMWNGPDLILLRTQIPLVKQSIPTVEQILAFQGANHLIAEHKLNQSDIIHVRHCYAGECSEV